MDVLFLVVEHSRDSHACVGIVEGTIDPQSSHVGLVCVEMLDVATFRLNPVFVEVGEAIQGGMAGGTVIAL